MKIITDKILKETFIGESYGNMPVDTKREMTNYVEKKFSSFIEFYDTIENLILNNVIEYEIYKEDKLFVCYVQENNNLQQKFEVKLNAKDFKRDNKDSLLFYIANTIGDFIDDDFSTFKGIWDGGNAGRKTVAKFRDEDERGQLNRSPNPTDGGRAYIIPGEELDDNSDIVNKDDKIRKIKGEDNELKLPFLHEPLLNRR